MASETIVIQRGNMWMAKATHTRAAGSATNLIIGSDRDITSFSMSSSCSLPYSLPLLLIHPICANGWEKAEKKGEQKRKQREEATAAGKSFVI